MNYTTIKETAYGYADRADVDTLAMYESFLRIVEARVNKKLKTQAQGSRQATACVTDQTEYDLPAQFAGLRDINVTDGNGGKVTMHLVTPEVMNGLRDGNSASLANNYDISYCILADEIEIWPAQPETSLINFVYYKQVPALNSTTQPINWISVDHPDCYVFGLMVEISAYVKDAEAKALWENRFKESMLDIHLDDAKSRWSGAPMQMKVG